MKPLVTFRLHRSALALALAVAFALFGTSCTERMRRITPFSGASSSDRVNAWPLYYHDRGATSVLWPIFDVDDKGFALRPIVSKEKSEVSVLFPWSSFDTNSGTGWAFPFYRFDRYSGVFPIANFSKLSWVGPIWWKNGSGGEVESGGLFPIVHFDHTNWVGPVFWRSGGGKNVDGGLFPVAMFGRLNYVGLFWWTEGFGSHGLFPLYGKGLGGRGLYHLGPFWWSGSSEGGFAAGLFPILDFDSDGSELAIRPLYSHDLGPESRRRNFLLGLGHTESSKGRKKSWLFPLYYHREEPEKSDTALLPFFWKRTRGEEAKVYTLLGNRTVDAESKSFNLYPLWWSNESGDSSWKMLLPFFYYSKDGPDRNLITPLGGRGWSREGGSRYFNFLGPVYHHSRTADGSRERRAFLWPLFERSREGNETTTRALPFFTRTSTPDATETSYALGLGHSHRTESGSSRRLWPLYASSDEAKDPDFLYRFTLYGSRSHGGTTTRRLFPLFSSETSGARKDVDFAFGLGNWYSGKAQRSWRLWPLVSRTVGDPDPSLGYETTLFGSSKWDGGRSLHVGGPFLFRDRKTARGGVTERKTRVLTLFTRTQLHDSRDRLPWGTRREPRNVVRRLVHGFLFGLFKNERAEYRVWRKGAVSPAEERVLRLYTTGAEARPDQEPVADSVRSILDVRDLAPPDDDPYSLDRAVAAFTAASTETVRHRKVRLPLLYGYERTGEDVDWSGPLWAVRSKKRANRSSFSFLYYVYRRETRGERTTRDLFPFVTWDTAPDETRFSFLWRLFRYERKGERRGGHVFFIPWGDA